MATGSSNDELEATMKKLVASFSRIAKGMEIGLTAGESESQQLRKELCDCWDEMVDVCNKCETSINQEKFKEMQERYKLLLSQASDSDKEDTSCENSISSRSSAASRKRRAELRLRQ